MPPYPPLPLPPDLLGVPFTTAEARLLGVHPERLRGSDLERAVYGVRGPVGMADSFIERCRLFATRLGPDVFFSHSTAALLLGAPLPRRFERMPRLHVTVAAPRRAPHASGILGHSRRVESGDVAVIHGLPVSSPARMFCEMGAVLDVAQLVALVDYLIRRGAPLCTVDDLVDRLAAGDRLVRRRILRVALGLSDDRAESPPESWLRVVLTLAGLPPEATNHDLRTASGSRFRLDLAYVAQKVAVEYQGAYHLTADQRRRDMSRRVELEADGWIVVELNSDHLGDAGSVIRLVREALARAAAR